jgi:hypothetical protein
VNLDVKNKDNQKPIDLLYLNIRATNLWDQFKSIETVISTTCTIKTQTDNIFDILYELIKDLKKCNNITNTKYIFYEMRPRKPRTKVLG